MILESPRDVIPRSDYHGRQSLPSLHYKSHVISVTGENYKEVYRKAKRCRALHLILSSSFLLDVCSHEHFHKICLANIRNETGEGGKPVRRCALILATAAQNWDLVLMDLRLFHLGDKWGGRLSPNPSPPQVSKGCPGGW